MIPIKEYLFLKWKLLVFILFFDLIYLSRNRVQLAEIMYILFPYLFKEIGFKNCPGSMNLFERIASLFEQILTFLFWKIFHLLADWFLICFPRPKGILKGI